MIICEHCGAAVTGSVCEYCNMPVKNPAPPKIKIPEKPAIITHKKEFRRAVIAGAVSVFAVITAVMAVMANRSERTYIPPVTEHAIEHHHEEDDIYPDDSYSIEEALPYYDAGEIMQSAGVFPSGTYQIGVDIPEGLYVFIPDMADGHGVEGVYADPECEEQISTAYVHFDGSRIAELSGGGYVDFSWATAYNLDMHPEIMNDPYQHDGMFIVGRDIPAGTYHLAPYGEYGEYAEWYIYSGINALGAVQKSAGTISGDYSENATDVITLSDGEFLELRDCTIDNS